MTVNIYNQAGEMAGTLDLPERVFGVGWNADLVHQAAVTQMANARRPWAHVKTRGEVRGGGKKPWKQKGTGRARHGSTRSPIWVGGGITHGPRNEKDYSKKLNKKMKQHALFAVLSRKAGDGELVVIDQLAFANAKTKEAAKLLATFAEKKIFARLRKDDHKDVLVLMGAKNETTTRVMRNIGYAKTLGADSLNVVDLLTYKYVLMPKDAVEVIEKTFTRNPKIKAQMPNKAKNPKPKKTDI